MVLAKFVVFLSLLYVISGASVSMQQAYLAMDTQIPASCHDMPNNQICPSFSHQIVGENANPQALTLRALHSVKLQVGVAIFFQDNQACINNVSEYACSNSLMKCTKSNATVYGFMLNYDVQRTRQACANVQKSCSPHVQEATVHNCSVIQTDPFEFAICNKHTDFPGDVCPRTDYMHPVAMTKFYRTFAEKFKVDFSIYGAGALKNGTCTSEVIAAYCHILRGAVCSADMQKRMFPISQQECAATIQKCVNPGLFQMHLLESCKLLPDGTTVTKVPLPTVPSSNNGNNANINNGNNGNNANINNGK